MENQDNKVASDKAKSVIFDTIFEELSEHKFFGIIMSKTKMMASEKMKTKILDIVNTLNSQKIDYKVLTKLIFDGMPDDVPSLRSLVWKIMLDYLTLNANEWEETIDKKRAFYNQEKERLYTKLELEKQRKNKEESESKDNVEVLDEDGKVKGEKKTVLKKRITMDHPLSLTENSKWKSYFDDIELFEEVDKDVRRTRTHMHFFFMPARTNVIPISNKDITDLADKKRNEPGHQNLDKKNVQPFETNADIMCRILFLYAKKHPEVRYIQGMNEVLAPILYCFSNDQNPYFYLNIEADCYICFENLMNEIKDIFIRNRDNTETGIQTRIKDIFNIIKIIDKDLHAHLVSESVEIQYFMFRWYTLFLTQEFEMPDILRLWDSLLAYEERFEFMNLMCLAIMKLKRPEIMAGDFAGIMLAVQNLEKLDIEQIIKTGIDIRNDMHKYM